MKAYARTDRGRKRQINQDAVYYSTYPVGNIPNLFLVADGMGGHKAGDFASKYTIDNLVSLVEEAEGKAQTKARLVVRRDGETVADTGFA